MKKSYSLVIICAAVLSFIITGCHPPIRDANLQRFRETKLLLGTIIHVDICCSAKEVKKKDVAYQEVWEMLARINRQMNAYDPDSDVSRINHCYPNSIIVAEDTFRVLQEAIDLYHLTAGYFDITVKPYVDIVRTAEKNNRLPSPADYAEIAKAVGIENLRMLPERKVEVLNPKTKIDLGGIAKGYAVDRAAEILRAQGFRDFYIDAGGEVYVGGRNCENKPWRIGVRDPRDQDNIIDVVELTDAAISTSGNYQQFYVIEGRKVSHIIHPLKGIIFLPDENSSERISASVIAPQGTIADGLSTALMIFPQDQWRQLIDRQGPRYAGLVLSWDEHQEKIGEEKSTEWDHYRVRK